MSFLSLFILKIKDVRESRIKEGKRENRMRENESGIRENVEEKKVRSTRKGIERKWDERGGMREKWKR